MLLVFEKSRNNPRKAIQLHIQKYHERVVPNLKVFSRMKKKLNANNMPFSSREGRNLAKKIILTLISALFHNILKNIRR